MNTHPFVHRFPRRAWRWEPPEGPAAVVLQRQWPMRAGDHVVRPGRQDVWDTITARIKIAPSRRAFYLGRVEEVDEAGNVQATLWEWPSGRAIFATLANLREDEREGPEPAPGDGLRIWTWVELPGEGQSITRRFVEVRRRELSALEREELLRLADKLEDESSA